MGNKNLPDFFVVGAAKSGTTSLYHYLKNHPNIFLPKNKEPQFFSNIDKNKVNPEGGNYADSIVSDISSYEDIYEAAQSENYLRIGDFSTSYLYYYDKAISNIKKLIGNPYIIIVLRNPVERAYSNYMHHVRDGYEKFSFEDALTKIGNRKKEHWWWGYELKDVGLYYNQVRAYKDAFDKVEVLLFEDVNKNTQNVIDKICGFLGVEKIQVNTDRIYNKSGITSSPFKTFVYKSFNKDSSLKKLIKNLIPGNARAKIRGKVKEEFYDKQLVKPKMNEETRQELIAFYRNDILKLQDLLKRDLSHWLQ